MKIFEIGLFGASIHIRIEIKFKLDFETKDIFKKWKAMILKRLRRVLVLNLSLIRKRTLSTYKSKAILQYKNKCMVA
jgi:hypothetical protein